MLVSVRRSALALIVSAAAWASGCATTGPRPMVDTALASGGYTPTRIALLPPDVFVVVDQAGDNDQARSAALGQAVSQQTVQALWQGLRSRGYDVDLSARWDGVMGADGQPLVTGQELGWMANGILQFANSPAGGATGPAPVSRFVAPELAARIGSATESDAILYVNVKGVAPTAGKRTLSVMAGVFIVVIVAAIIVIAVASAKGGGGGGHVGVPGGNAMHAVPRAAPSAWHGTPVGAASGSAFRGVPPGTAAPVSAFRGAPPPVTPVGGWRGGAIPPGAVVYHGGPAVNVGVDVIVPLDEPVYTHDGTVAYDDPLFAGDNLYASMTLVSAWDGRILWHQRAHLDLAPDEPGDVDQMVQAFLGGLPPRAGFGPAPAPTAAR
jgi:hypothetical protein